METRAELYQYIDDITKVKYEEDLTLDEIYKIGILHKSLPKTEKSWKGLATKIHYKGTGESLRSFINREQSRRNELEMADKEDILSDNESYEQLYKEKTQIRDIYNAYRRDLRSESRNDRFRDTLIDSIKKLPKLEFSKAKVVPTKNGVEAILLFSDLHLGVNCNNFYNKYNYNIAVKRVSKLVDDTVAYCLLHNVTKLNVLNLGDLIHGIIHTNARIQAELDLSDQIIFATEILANMLVELDNRTSATVVYRSCTDNHSRIFPNKEENIENENLSRIIDWYLAARLNGSNIQLVNDNIDDSLGKFTLMNGKTVMFAHGHLETINKCVDAFSGATKQFVDYVFLSHYHNSKEKSYNGSKVFVNGSIVGTEQYALSKRLFSPAEQKLIIFDTNNVLDLNIDLQI